LKKSLVRRAANRLFALLARFLPGATTLRPTLHRLRGVKITGKVFIGEDVYVENEYPENVEIQHGASIALRSVLIAHTRGPGKIIIGRNAFIGANCVIMAPPGRTVTIGEGAVIKSSTLVSANVPGYTFFGLPTAQPLATVTVPLTMETSYEQFLGGLKPLRSAVKKNK
jgi:carbonic anhydrase/acetyltransferase-like protein (isoleucine patch superfamily)